MLVVSIVEISDKSEDVDDRRNQHHYMHDLMAGAEDVEFDSIVSFGKLDDHGS